jgi:hypothetical protein
MYRKQKDIKHEIKEQIAKTKKQESEIIYPPSIKELFPNHKFP